MILTEVNVGLISRLALAGFQRQHELSAEARISPRIIRIMVNNRIKTAKDTRQTMRPAQAAQLYRGEAAKVPTNGHSNAVAS